MGTDIHGVFQKRTQTGWEDISSDYDQDRHYQLFAVLADVRNGYGFAGLPTGEVITPISRPRGLPADFLMEGENHPIQELAHMDPRRREWQTSNDPMAIWMGDHSHSWLTGEEMLAWTKTTLVVTKTGIVSREVYESWDGKSSPMSWSGALFGKDVLVINDNAIEREQNPHWTHIRIHWEQSLLEELGYFFDEVARLVAEHGEVRFVFGFDS